MEIGGQSVPTTLLVLAALAVLAMAFVLADLYRHDVAHLPKWAWAAIVVLGNFPLGAIAYFVIGRRATGDGVDDPVDRRPRDRDPTERANTPTRPHAIDDEAARRTAR